MARIRNRGWTLAVAHNPSFPGNPSHYTKKVGSVIKKTEEEIETMMIEEWKSILYPFVGNNITT